MDSPAPDAMNPSIFETSGSLLESVLAMACQDQIADYRVRLTPRTGTEGICGEYLLAAFTVSTTGGGAVEVPMFVRRQIRASDSRRQAHHYRYLSNAGVPLPRLYGSHLDSAGREVIFLELLDELRGSDSALLSRQDYLADYLRLAASLAAVPLTDDYVGQLGSELAGRDFVINWGIWLPWSAHILGRIEARASTGELGHGLREYCSKRPTAIAQLREVCLPLMGAIRSLPLGLVHGDLRPGNTGRRKPDGQLVLYDLEDLTIDARFYDVAQVLGGPLPLLPGTNSNHDLAELFLRAYAERCGRAVNIGVFLREARLAWAARKINLWELLPPSAGGPPYDHRAFVGEDKERSEKLLSTITELSESIGPLCQAISCAA